MDSSSAESLKRQVHDYWNRQSCDTQVACSVKFSQDYYEEIERFRYWDQPFIHSFAQFSRYHGKRVLEVGFGSGTDFVQWLRAGAAVSGVDLTQEALDNLSNRIRAYNLPSPEKILVGDAENLPFEEDSFDLGYSFGVLHHSPDTEQAFRELVRVIRPGGELKVMLYNRHSVYVCGQWTKHALLRGRPWKSLSWILWNHVESRGTKGYTRRDLRRILTGLPLEAIRVHTEVTSADYLSASTVLPLNRFFRLCLRAAGVHFDWHPSRYVSPLNTHQKASDSASSPRSIIFTGNSLGFYHCITARKVAG